MKVGIDISQIVYGGGVATYTKNLVRALLKCSRDNQTMDYVLFGSNLGCFNDLNHWNKQFGGQVTSKLYPLPTTLLEFVWNRMHILRVEELIGEVDVFHSSDWTQPPAKAKKVTTYHDVVPLKYPQWSHPKIVSVHKRRLKRVEEEADCVIAVSDATKKDLLEVSKIPAEKVVVIYEGVGEEFKRGSEADVAEFKKRMRLPDEFILGIGGVGSRRNLDRVKVAAHGYNLVITGQTIPRVPQNDLPLLYSAAKVLLYPSFYEGFGLPVVEAMACGTPVITANISAMPEVGGAAALYVDPMDEGEIRDKLREVWVDEDLRQSMVKKGLRQAEKFTWEKCAKQTVEVYRKVAGQG